MDSSTIRGISHWVICAVSLKVVTEQCLLIVIPNKNMLLQPNNCLLSCYTFQHNETLSEIIAIIILRCNESTQQYLEHAEGVWN